MQEKKGDLPIDNPIREQEPRKPVHWASAAQLFFSILAGLGFWGIALTFALFGAVLIFGFPTATGAGLSMDATSLFLLAASLFWMGLLVIPSAFYAGKRLKNSVDVESPGIGKVSIKFFLISLVVLTISLWLGYSYGKERYFASFVLPILHILTISLPVFWMACLGGFGLPSPRPRQMWGVLAASLTLGPFIIMLLEIMAMLLFMFLAIVVLVSQPGWIEEVSQIGLRLSYAPNEVVIERIILPYLVTPGVALPLLLYVALIVPLIEEALKPIGVWLLLPGGLNGPQGFVIGLVSGAGYTLFESLLLAMVSNEWTTVVLGRAATGLLHIANCGLVGWALAEAFGSKFRPKGAIRRLWGAYLLAVALHGLWNGLTMFGLWVTLAEKTASAFPAWLMQLGKASPFGLIAITLFALMILITKNITARRRIVFSLEAAPTGDLSRNDLTRNE
jgi:hypothetical protein